MTVMLQVTLVLAALLVAAYLTTRQLSKNQPSQEPQDHLTQEDKDNIALAEQYYDKVDLFEKPTKQQRNPASSKPKQKPRNKTKK